MIGTSRAPNVTWGGTSGGSGTSHSPTLWFGGGGRRRARASFISQGKFPERPDVVGLPGPGRWHGRLRGPGTLGEAPAEC